MNASTTAPISSYGGVDFGALRAQRSPFWRPGMNTRFEPYVALAETNLGHIAVPCGRSADHAREIVARWQAEAATDGRRIYGAAVIDPRGEISEAWRAPDGGSVPDPAGSPRWAPLRRLSQDARCARCGEQRWPGCYVALDQAGCSQCMPLDEDDDPRVWPVEPAAA